MSRHKQSPPVLVSYKENKNYLSRNHAHKPKPMVMNLFIYFLAFLITCVLIHALDGNNGLSSVARKKLAQFYPNKDTYNVVFLGPSTVYRHIIPVEFNKKCLERGINVKSYNAGVWGANFFELRRVLNKIKASRPKNLRWVFIEVVYSCNLHGSTNTPSPQFSHRHVAGDLLLARQLKLPSNISTTSSYQNILHAAKAVLMDISNRGLLTDFLQNVYRTSPSLSAEKLRNNDGFYALDDEKGNTFHLNHLNFLGNQADYEASVRHDDIPYKQLPKQSIASLRELVRIVRSMGAEPILVQSATRPATYPYLPPANLRQSWLNSYQRPSSYPELFDVSNRFNSGHLSKAGALRYTHLLADDFTKKLFREKPPS